MWSDSRRVRTSSSYWMIRQCHWWIRCVVNSPSWIEVAFVGGTALGMMNSNGAYPVKAWLRSWGHCNLLCRTNGTERQSDSGCIGCENSISYRTLQKSSRLLERRVVSTGIVIFTLLVVELSTVEWTMPVVNRVCMTKLLFASKEVPDGMCRDLQIFPTIWQNAFCTIQFCRNVWSYPFHRDVT